MTQGPWNRLVREYERQLKRLLTQAGNLSPERLLDLWSNAEFQHAAAQLAQRIVGKIQASNARTWREAAMRGSHAREIYRHLQQELTEPGGPGAVVARAVAENARMIRSIPADLARQITAFAAEQQAAGKRAPEVERELRRRAPYLAESKIRLIARTEIGKAEAAITRARATELGADWYQWQTAEDQRVRPSHHNLDQVLVRWSDPPQPEALIGERSTLGPGAPGEFPNCRCVSLPILALAELRFPVRVYRDGTITRMTKAQFSRLALLPAA